MKIHGEHKFRIVLIIRIDEMPYDHSFGHRSPIQLYCIQYCMNTGRYCMGRRRIHYNWIGERCPKL